MRVIVPVATLVAITLSTLLGSNTAAPSVASAQDMGPIGVIDVAYIFKNDPSIKSQIESVKSQLQTIDSDLKRRRNELKSAAELLKTFKPGSDQFASQEEKVATMESKLRLDMGRKQKELQDSEAKIYYDNYQRIAAGVKVIAEHYKVKVVLRYNSEEMQQDKGESVLRGVMKSVVYYDPNIDMTQGVMSYLNRIASR